MQWRAGQRPDLLRSSTTRLKAQGITNLLQLEGAWEADESLAQKVWWVLFGEFDKWTDWDLELEEAIMKQYQWEYNGFSRTSRSKHQKGCIAKIVVLQKVQIVKTGNDSATETDGDGEGKKGVRLYVMLMMVEEQKMTQSMLLNGS